MLTHWKIFTEKIVIKIRIDFLFPSFSFFLNFNFISNDTNDQTEMDRQTWLKIVFNSV